MFASQHAIHLTPYSIPRRANRWSQQQLFDLVADVNSYEEFLPWCSSSRVLTERDGGCTAEIAVGFPPVHERYVSEVRSVFLLALVHSRCTSLRACLRERMRACLCGRAGACVRA